VSSLSIVADQQILLAEEAFSNFGDVQLVDGRSIERRMIKDSDVLLVRSVTNVDESLLKNSNVSFVGSATSGINHIDVDYLNKSNIHFSHALGSNARSVAEYVLSSLLVTAELNDFILTDKTVGIIGCGQVGSRLKQFMDVLGVKCLLNDPPRAEYDSDVTYVELEQVLEADIITLHVPLTTDGKYPTNNFINKQVFDELKSDVVFVNTARGEVVEETALLEFKNNNPQSTLILDVWRNEPNINTDLIKRAFIATPHIAGYSYDGKLKATNMLLDSLSLYINNDSIKSGVSSTEFEKLFIEDDIMRLAVMQSYDVRSDGIALKNINDVVEAERANYFDSLRKNYPVRREFTNKLIQTKSIDSRTRHQLQQMGFQVETV
jgi:erythronate-4-phosphate dehydrogenase